MDWLTAIVEVIRAIAWPGAVLVAVTVFRRQLAQLLPRVREVGPAGVKIAAPDQTAVDLSPEPIEHSTTAASLPAPAGGVLLPTASAPLSLFEDSIRRDLGNLPVHDASSREHVLVRGLAATQMELAFERIYAVIFGSQIRLLKDANVMKIITAEYAFQIYTEAKSAWPAFHVNRPFEMWRDFLTGSGLLELEPSGSLIPTPACTEFLAYMTRRQMPEFKTG